MLSIRAARKKKVYLENPDPTDRSKDDLMQPIEHSKAVQVTHDFLSEEQVGQGSSNILDLPKHQ